MSKSASDEQTSVSVSDPLSTDELVARGNKARRGRDILNNCWYINRDLRDELWGWVEEHSLPGCSEDYVGVKRVTVTNRQQTAKHQKHYVTFVDSRLVADSLADEGHLLVDAALDQFNDWNHNRDLVPLSLGPRNSLAAVVIAPPGDAFRVDVYHEMFNINIDEDVRVGLPI